jgi:hypothetical protein
MTTWQRIVLAVVFVVMLAIWISFEISVWNVVAIFLWS